MQPGTPADDDGMWHCSAELGTCPCREHLAKGIKSVCSSCGEAYSEGLGGGKGCTRCFAETVKNLELSRGATEDETEIVSAHGVGRAAWNEQRIRWNKREKDWAPRSICPDTREFESEVTTWVSTGGSDDSRPRYDSIPLGLTIRCLQNLDTWVPIGRLK
eukprot:TRINITY_DN65682_c0_g1_i1.p2 TRINITY_DN65682_c0_g1~~TRINITY_DN65682_c0_g1_i1.p2  ORF type:complete len:160 (+),score=33.33 TRINITY_DN65682_c0_g1_i1:157-636(+)